MNAKWLPLTSIISLTLLLSLLTQSAWAGILASTYTSRDAMYSILEDLEYNAPNVTIDLAGALPSPAVSNLERADIFEIIPPARFCQQNGDLVAKLSFEEFHVSTGSRCGSAVH